MAQNSQAAQEPKRKVSRIGKAPITVPAGVKVNVEGSLVKVEGPKGKLSQEVTEGIKVVVDGSQVIVECADGSLGLRQKHGLFSPSYI